MNQAPLLLTPVALATACDGEWIGSPPSVITGISLSRQDLQPGDLYIRLDTTNAVTAIQKAIAQGAVAVMVSTALTCPNLSVPLLRVDDPVLALRKMAKASRSATKAQKVLVTGSYGKTGFKTQLYHVLQGQMPTHAVLNSNNSLNAICKSLVTLRADDAVSIIEVAVPSPNRGETASKLVLPSIAVITWIGHEHLNQNGGTQDHIIANKVKIVSHLPLQGKVLLPEQSGVIERLSACVQQLRPDVEQWLFGETDHCQGQLVHKTFSGQHWLIQARIVDQWLEYRLPLWELYAPLSSVSVLLAVYCLGGDVRAAAQQFLSYQNFKSSGHCYELQRGQTRFWLFDQSTRIGLEAFKATLQLMATLKPQRQGRKIAVFTEFYSLENAPRDILDLAEFQRLIQASGMDCLYTAANFCEHINVLPDKRVWRNHSHNIVNLLDEIIASLQPDDMLFVRGAVEEGAVGLDSLVEILLQKSQLLKQWY